MYKSHKGWTSNHNPQEKWQRFTGIKTTRGARQTKLKCNCAIFSIMYQSHKGWTSNTIGTIYVAGDQAYQSHKGWTSNSNKPYWFIFNSGYQSPKGWTSNKAHQARHRSS